MAWIAMALKLQAKAAVSLTLTMCVRDSSSQAQTSCHAQVRPRAGLVKKHSGRNRGGRQFWGGGKQERALGRRAAGVQIGTLAGRWLACGGQKGP